MYDTKYTIGKRKNNLDLIKIKTCYASKDAIKKVKRSPTEWEKTFAHHVFDKRLGVPNAQRSLTTQSQKDNPVKNGPSSWYF